MNKSKRIKIVFYIYIAIVIKVIIFKYPWEDLKAIMDTWEKGVILEGLDTANFTLFKTIKMYINYSYKLNSFENLVGNVVVFVPFGFLLPSAPTTIAAKKIPTVMYAIIWFRILLLLLYSRLSSNSLSLFSFISYPVKTIYKSS